MIIKTITTWADYNYGASLQAYALLTFLRGKGHDVEMIQYLPPYQTRMYDYMWVNPESKASRYFISRWLYRAAKLAQRMTTLGRKRVFDEFNFQTLPLTKEKYHSFKELCLNPPVADLYIVGSDQVWNVLYEAGRDPSFYLEFVEKGKKASYAASFSYLDIDAENRKRIVESLYKFEGVAVREYQGQDLLKSMGIESTWVLDPVFLLPLSKWNELASQADVPLKYLSDNYLLIYDFEGNETLKRFAQEYARFHNLQIYAITDKYPLHYVHYNFKKAGPKEFVQLIRNSKAFISNSFHGTAFSIMYHIPFYVFNRHRHKVNSRMDSLLTLFDLKECLLDTDEKMNNAIKLDFDWNKIDLLKEKKLQDSLDFMHFLQI